MKIRLCKTVCMCLFALLNACAAFNAGAFPVPFEASGDIFPWAPTPTDGVTLSVIDTLNGCVVCTPGRPDTIQISQVGNHITVLANWIADYTGTGCIPCQFQVDLGVLPAGQYTVDYTQGTGVPNASFHQVTIGFTVTATGYATAVEYFAPSLGHYFVTSNSAEITALDNGTIPGWTRTGGTFKVIPADVQPTTALSVCRFYGLPQAGLNSHFFTSSQSECSAVQQRWPNSWLLETTDAFAVLPTGAECAPGAISLYRLYNNRPDANHRFTTSPAIRDQMIAAGWVLEGDATISDGLTAMCVPQ